MPIAMSAKIPEQMECCLIGLSATILSPVYFKTNSKEDCAFPTASAAVRHVQLSRYYASIERLLLGRLPEVLRHPYIVKKDHAVSVPLHADFVIKLAERKAIT